MIMCVLQVVWCCRVVMISNICQVCFRLSHEPQVIKINRAVDLGHVWMERDKMVMSQGRSGALR